MNRVALAMALAVVLLPALLLSGCIWQGNEASEEEKRTVFNYAGPAVDRMMQGFNDGNYTRFSAEFGDILRKAMTPTRFGELREGTISKIGLYMSRGGAAVEKIGELYRVAYTTDWERESGVKLTVTFMKDDPQHLIQGLWFDSLKLRG